MKKIACIGNITFDILAYTDNFPKEDSRVNYKELIMGYGGPAVNAATVINKFGKNVDLYGVLGNDVFSSLILDELIKTDINKKILFKDKFTPPLNYIIISENNKTRTINSYKSNIDGDFKFNNLETDYDIILTDGKYYQGTLDLFENNKNAIKVIDAGRCNENVIELSKKCDYVICSEEFANNFMKHLKSQIIIDFSHKESVKEILEYMEKYFSSSKVIITVGKDGYVYLDDKKLVHEPAFKVGKVIETNAAGDIFHGAFVYAIANNYKYKEALLFANITSSMSVTRKGGKISCPELKEIKKYKKTITK